MDFIEPCFGIGHNLSLICQMTSEDIKHQLIIIITADVGDTDVTATGRRRRDVSVAAACRSPVAAHTSDGRAAMRRNLDQQPLSYLSCPSCLIAVAVVTYAR